MILTLVARLSSFILLELLVLSSCGDKVAEKHAATSIDSKKPSLPSLNTKELSVSSLQSTNTEYLEWNTATLNGRLPMMSTTKAAFQELGQPDSLVTPDMNDVCVSFFDKPFKDAYMKMTNLEVYGDTVVVRTINFQHQLKLTLQSGSIRLNSSTTLSELAKSFPAAVKEQYELDVYKLGKVTAVNLATGPIVADDAWLLMFKDGKLIRIDYWMPC